MLTFQPKAQSSLIVNMQDGSEEAIPLTLLNKITFSGNNIVFDKVDSTPVNYQISLLNRMYFDSSTLGTESETISAETASLVVYPNPATSHIRLDTQLSGTTLVYILNLDGRIALLGKISSSGDAIDVSSLPFGFYIVKVNNLASKFLKR